MIIFEYGLLAVGGLVVGSFLNAWLWRTHEGMSVLRGRSCCPACRKPLAVRDLIPLISFMLLRGRCRMCSASISWQYPIVEVVTAVSFLSAYHVFLQAVPSGLVVSFLASNRFSPDHLLFIRNLCFLSILLFIAIYDLKWYLILDHIAVPALAISFFINGFLFSSEPCASLPSCLVSISWLNLVTAAGIGGGFFLIQYLVSQGRWIGGGDIRLGALMGVMLGFPGVLFALFLAYMIGSCAAVFLLASRKKERQSEIPFAPFLTLATAIVLLYQPLLSSWWQLFYAF